MFEISSRTGSDPPTPLVGPAVRDGDVGLPRRSPGRRVRLATAVNLQFTVRTGRVFLAPVRDRLALPRRVGFEAFTVLGGRFGDVDEPPLTVRAGLARTSPYVARGKIGSVVKRIRDRRPRHSRFTPRPSDFRCTLRLRPGLPRPSFGAGRRLLHTPSRRWLEHGAVSTRGTQDTRPDRRG
jgi:hypothetical protein